MCSAFSSGSRTFAENSLKYYTIDQHHPVKKATPIQKTSPDVVIVIIVLRYAHENVSPLFGGRGSPVVKISDRSWHVRSSSPGPLKTRRVGARCTLNLSRSQTSSRLCGS
ncbi:hypothetical protein TNCV_1410011 [Trichonephila clavipes]|nr:hypothetical protein TNCV_1410011 [Trichonephila clavipes]